MKRIESPPVTLNAGVALLVLGTLGIGAQPHALFGAQSDLPESTTPPAAPPIDPAPDDAVAQIFIAQHPIGGASGDTLRTPMVLLRNARDQLLRTDNSTVVRVEVASGEDGTLIGDLERVAEGGMARFPLSFVGRTDQEYTLRFSAAGLSVESHSFRVSAGPPAPERTEVYLPSGAAGLPTPVEIILHDAHGNRVGGLAESLQIEVARGPNAAASLEPIVEADTGRYLSSYVPRWTGEDSVAIHLAGTPLGSPAGDHFTSAVLPGSPHLLTLAIAPVSVLPSGALLQPTPVVQLRDSLGNTVPEAGREVCVKLLGGEGRLAGSTCVPGDSNGAAHFTDLTLSGRAGVLRLEFSADGVLPVQHSIEVQTGSADLAASSATMPPAMAGRQATIIITLFDSGGNRVTGAADMLTIEVAGSNAGAGLTAAHEVERGEYVAHYDPERSGRDEVMVMIDGAELRGSPFPLEIAGALRTTSEELPPWSAGAPGFAAGLGAEGGRAPYRWALASGAGPLPDGLTLTAEGVLSGTPELSGAYTIELELSDQDGFATMAVVRGIFNPAPQQSGPPLLPPAEKGFAYSTTLGWSGGTAPARWSVIRGELPPAIDLDPMRGELFGVPTRTGSYTFAIELRDAAGSTVSREFSLLVALPPPPPTTPGVPLEVRAQAGDGRVELSWSAPLHDGGSPIAEYQIDYSSDGGVSWHRDPAPASGERTRRIEGLTNRVGYTFRIRAVNLIGAGSFSEPTAAVIPRSDRPELEIEMRSDSDPVIMGDTITLIIVVRNQGGRSAEEVVITLDPAADPGAMAMPPPRRLRLLDAELTEGVFDPVGQSWQVGPLAAGRSARAAIRAEVLDPTQEEEIR